MTFKPAIWFPIAVLLSIANLVGVGFAAEPLHASTHAALALAFGLWAYRLRQGSGASELEVRLEELEAEVSRLGEIEVDVSKLRQELGEAQERLDFAERLLVQAPEPRRVDPQR
jgi:hypothetical protein